MGQAAGPNLGLCVSAMKMLRGTLMGVLASSRAPPASVAPSAPAAVRPHPLGLSARDSTRTVPPEASQRGCDVMPPSWRLCVCPGAPRGGVHPWPSRIFTLDGSRVTEAEEICVPWARTSLELASSCPVSPEPTRTPHLRARACARRAHGRAQTPPLLCEMLGEQEPSLLSMQDSGSYPVSERGEDDPRTRGLV